MDNVTQTTYNLPLVSIITVVLNGEKGIRQSIESVINQSYPNIEYILIDGGSTDRTIDIIKEYTNHISSWKSEADDGISDAFNKGIRDAQGDIVGLLNAGDWYEPNTVQCVVEAFSQSTSIDIVCGALQFWKEDSRQYLCQSVPDLLESDMSITHPTCFLRKALYLANGMFSANYKYAMDYELLLRMKCSGAVFHALNDTLANMQHDGLSEMNWREALRETQRARREILQNSFYAKSAYYCFLYSKRRIRVLLEHLKLEALIKLYRERFALVKKTK